MCKNINVVIGANYGDEGKGLMTDFFSSRCSNGLVVRFNGGAQAGHTVVRPDGVRHVFGHVGSGTFCGLPTYLSEFFVVNPLFFYREMGKLHSKRVPMPTVYTNPRCLVTTPYDIMLNHIIESFRGSSRHGSCGAGFNETIVRNSYIPLKVSDLGNSDLVISTLREIKQYVPKRLRDLGVDQVHLPFVANLMDESIIDKFVCEDINYFMSATRTVDDSILCEYSDIIFEGAQGLLLDQNHINFPHVTRSNTGLQNVISILDDLGVVSDNMSVTYVTRAYLTRHGAGPFPTELADKPYPGILDMTNVPNPCQGSLRFGHLNISGLSAAVTGDLNKSLGKHTIHPSLAITCLDQLDDIITLIKDGVPYFTNSDMVVGEIMKECKMSTAYCSYGPTRETIKIVKS